jgi:hypothetical protein
MKIKKALTPFAYAVLFALALDGLIVWAIIEGWVTYTQAHP